MFDRNYGPICFMYKSSPNWSIEGKGSWKLLVTMIDEDDGYSYKVIIEEEERLHYADEEMVVKIDEEDEISEIDEYEKNRNTKIIVDKSISEEEFSNVIKIIEKHKDLVMVNTEIRIPVCDGSFEEFYFEGITFNRSTSGDCIVSIGNHSSDEDLGESKELDEQTIKSMHDAKIVSSAVEDILQYLNKLGVEF